MWFNKWLLGQTSGSVTHAVSTLTAAHYWVWGDALWDDPVPGCAFFKTLTGGCPAKQRETGWFIVNVMGNVCGRPLLLISPTPTSYEYYLLFVCLWASLCVSVFVGLLLRRYHGRGKLLWCIVGFCGFLVLNLFSDRKKRKRKKKERIWGGGTTSAQKDKISSPSGSEQGTYWTFLFLFVRKGISTPEPALCHSVETKQTKFYSSVFLPYQRELAKCVMSL